MPLILTLVINQILKRHCEIMNRQKSTSSYNHSRHSSGSDIEEVSMGNLSDMDNISSLNMTMKASESCPQLVKETETATHKHFELRNSKK